MSFGDGRTLTIEENTPVGIYKQQPFPSHPPVIPIGEGVAGQFMNAGPRTKIGGIEYSITGFFQPAPGEPHTFGVYVSPYVAPPKRVIPSRVSKALESFEDFCGHWGFQCVDTQDSTGYLSEIVSLNVGTQPNQRSLFDRWAGVGVPFGSVLLNYSEMPGDPGVWFSPARDIVVPHYSPKDVEDNARKLKRALAFWIRDFCDDQSRAYQTMRAPGFLFKPDISFREVERVLKRESTHMAWLQEKDEIETARRESWRWDYKEPKSKVSAPSKMRERRFDEVYHQLFNHN